jgi:hypothetical protein
VISNDKNSLFDRGSIGEIGLWVKGKTSQHIVVMYKRVQRIFAIEDRAGQVGEIGREELRINRRCQMLNVET